MGMRTQPKPFFRDTICLVEGKLTNPPGIVTVSLGMKIVNADDTDPLEAIYQKADHALYEAKQTGRDHFIIARS